MTRRRFEWGLLLSFVVLSAWSTILGRNTEAEWEAPTVRSVDKSTLDAAVHASTNLEKEEAQQREGSDLDTSNDCFRFSSKHVLEGSHNSSRTTIDIPYQCGGEDYVDFAERLHQYADEQQGNKPTHWGRSSAMLPTNAKVLIVGNAYTRQVAYSLVAQHSHQLTEIHNLEGRLVHRFDFSHGATLWELANSYVWYNRSHWVRYLENQIQVHLNDLDAIVLGPVGEATCINATTRSQVQLRDLLQPMPHMNCETDSPPSLEDWLRVFQGPIVYVSTFERDNPENTIQAQAVDAWQQQQKQKGGTDPRLTFVDARNHVQNLGIECATPEKNAVGTCVNATKGARCVGPRGGYPDLVAWDVMEHLHTHWRINEPKNVSHDKASFVANTPSSLPRMCRLPQIVAPNYPADRLPSIFVFYQCQGPRYLAFGQTLEDYVTASLQTIVYNQATLWPPNKNILLWGNSHTRQVGRTLVCQYSNQLESLHLLDTQLNLLPYLPERKTGAEVYRFSNNASLTILTNSYVPYSRKWQTLLEDELEGRGLQDFDAVILGHFNHCGGNNTFSADLQALSAYLPDVDCLHTTPPNVTEIAQAATGIPLIFFGMFDESRVEEARAIAKDIQNLSNVGFVDTRQLVESVSPTLCLSSKRFSTSDCRRADDPLGEGVILHACTGPYGGYADIVGWKVTETLWAQLAETK